MQTSSGLELLVELRRDDGEPLHRQLERSLREAVRDGRLPADSPLPSSRTLARELGLSRGVVVEAYEQLVAEGYLTSRQGGATRVAATAAPPAPPLPDLEPKEAPEIAFRYGRPDVTQFPREAWLRSLRRVMAEAPADRLSYVDGRGLPELRYALADYLNRVRGTCADPERMVITAGFAQALSLLSQVLARRGGQRIGLENPSDDTPRTIVSRAGLSVVPMEVDGRGLRVDALTTCAADAIVVTAAHQFPLGGVLPPERRSQLIEWARGSSAFVVEDDYDAEYRYDRDPIGAIHGLAPNRVVYVGSASKTLAPGLRLGWMVLPAELVEEVATTKYAADRGSPAIDQLAFADFLSRGELDRHLRRMRPIYRARRDALLEALGQHLPDLTPMGASAGLHLLAWLPPGLRERDVIAAAARRGLGVEGVSKYRIEPREDDPQALIFGYAGLSQRQISEGVQRLAQALRDLS